MSQIINKAILIQTKLNANLLITNKANNLLKVAKNYYGNTSEQFDTTQQQQQDIDLQRHNLRRLDEKSKYLNSKMLDYNPGWTNLNVLSLCEKSAGKFYINTKSGDFTCLTCEKTGNWKEFQKMTEKILEENKSSCSEDDEIETETKKQDKIEKPKLYRTWSETKQIKDLNDSQFRVLLRNSGLSDEIKKSQFEKHDIRIQEQNILTPFYDAKSKLVDIILVNSNDRGETLKKDQVYGLNLIEFKMGLNELYITDDILNLLALKQEIKKPVIVINSLQALSIKVLALLEKFDSIIIWHKDTKLSYNLAQKLNQNRCNLINKWLNLL
ncbi:unnamed protein product [Brachionus calyciflorus]|uniref:Uncharacterized protein n=1 Tax=Brachionus calyciflorus TaxID=104777 RepID=A0A814GKB2_9BILA|nr:unnamed protein product [Brachionus calyciflorus]